MLIRRNCPNEPDGKTVELGGTKYHFKPDADGENVAEVVQKAHISRLLAIDEGEAYEIKDPSGPLKNDAPPVKPKAATAATKGKGPDDPFAKPVDEIVDDNAPVPTEAELARARDDSDDAKMKPDTRKAPAKKSAKKR